MVALDTLRPHLTPGFVEAFRALGKQVGYRNLGRAIAYVELSPNGDKPAIPTAHAPKASRSGRKGKATRAARQESAPIDSPGQTPTKGVRCLQENLAAGIATVKRAAPKRFTLPQCECILLATEGGRLKLTATDLQTAITTWVGAKVDGELTIAVSAKALADAVNAFPKEAIALDIVDGGLRLTCEGRTTTLPIDASRQDFPPIPKVVGTMFTVDPYQLRHAIGQVEFAASKDDARPILTTLNAKIDSGQLTLACADGFRLAVHTLPLMSSDGQHEINIPARAMRHLARLVAKEDESVGFTIGEKAIRFDLHLVEITVALESGTFPDYSKLIPANGTAKATVYRDALLQEVTAAGAVAKNGSNIARLELLPDKVRVMGSDGEGGEYSGEVDAALEGKPGRIAFDWVYLRDTLRAVDAEQVTLEITSPTAPGVIRLVGQNGYSCVIMPMFVRE